MAAQGENSTPPGGSIANQALGNLGGLMSNAGTNNRGSSSSRSTSLSITPKETAYSQIDQEFLKLFGRRASTEVKRAYYNSLNSYEKKYATRSRSGGSSGTTYDATGNSISSSSDRSSSTNFAFDAGLFLQDFVLKYAQSEIVSGKQLGGLAGQNYATTAQYAADMGVSTNPQSLLKDTMDLISGSTDLVKLQNSYRERAAIKYSAYADLIKNNPGKSLRDLTIDQLDTVSKLIDVNVNNLSFDDTIVNKILSSSKDGKGYIMNNSEIAEFVRKNDQRFQYGTVAHTEAAQLGASFSSAFGSHV